jgi:hypothetical protein
MPNGTPFSIVSLKDTQVGDLVVTTDGDAQITAIVLRKDDFNDVVVAAVVKRSDEKNPYHWVKLELHSTCLSYGQDWVFELVLDDDVAIGQAKSRDTPGVAAAARSAISVHFAHPPEFPAGGSMDVDVINRKPINVGHSSTTFSQWRIWRNAEGQSKRTEEPLVVRTG